MLGFILKYVVGPILGTIIGRTALVVCHKLGWHPEEWLAARIFDSPAAFQSDLIWPISAAAGIFLAVGWNYFHIGERIRNLRRRKVEKPTGVIETASQPDPSDEATIIKMTVGEGSPYFATDGSLYAIRRTYILKLENTDRSKALSDCSVQIQSVTPDTDYGEGPWPLKDGIVLAAGQHVLIPLVTYGEARDLNKFACGDTFMTMGTPDGHPCLDADKEYTLTLRATAPETAYSEVYCRVWISDAGRLRIEEQTAAPSTIEASGDSGGQTQRVDVSNSPSWSELEQRFKELEASLQFSRIEGQTGAAGEYWRLAGLQDRDARDRFQSTAAMASTKLFRELSFEVRRHPELQSESDPVIRWYKALQYMASRYERDGYGEQKNEDGTSGGMIYTGSIQRPASASATLCLDLASRSDRGE